MSEVSLYRTGLVRPRDITSLLVDNRRVHRGGDTPGHGCVVEGRRPRLSGTGRGIWGTSGGGSFATQEV